MRVVLTWYDGMLVPELHGSLWTRSGSLRTSTRLYESTVRRVSTKNNKHPCVLYSVLVGSVAALLDVHTCHTSVVSWFTLVPGTWYYFERKFKYHIFVNVYDSTVLTFRSIGIPKVCSSSTGAAVFTWKVCIIRTIRTERRKPCK